jgi:hypothetical protein
VHGIKWQMWSLGQRKLFWLSQHAIFTRSDFISKFGMLQGRRRSLVLALGIICDAIDRYKELCEGAFCGALLSYFAR